MVMAFLARAKITRWDLITVHLLREVGDKNQHREIARRASQIGKYLDYMRTVTICGQSYIAFQIPLMT